ncbi:Diadenosine 5'5'''-P1,P4-tetraphosphate pyrophosphohydrolase [Vulgatibacter incomptus]|uniref:Bis(5'-nucleosyl)-tetraphosphatase [asymmetrical] n=1 Tax=Vulgatibacter incomptus TaxID=1391653 RepID=A0A0K1P981_9BACT|nr:Diadenosine 5'5'''-P1,P4-tetraphosphate pyrophosphohydrolase [Vulgatibacter incomptus]
MVPFREVDGKIVYLVISSAVTKREHWEFPKGGVEEGEREVQTALRELLEETGVSDVRLLPGFREPIRYIYRRPEGLVSKQVVYFIGKVGNPAVVLREVEAKDYRWADYDEAFKLLRHANARILLERCHAFIRGRPLPARPQRPRPPAAAQRVSPPPEAPPKPSAPEAKGRRRRRRRRGSQQPAAQGAKSGGQGAEAKGAAGRNPASKP